MTSISNSTSTPDAHGKIPRWPRFQWRKPSPDEVANFRAKNRNASLSYTALGESASGHPPGYTVDHNRVLLGHGEVTWTRACAALENWRMFPKPWTAIEPAGEPIAVGTTFAMLAHACGLWWMSGCRIDYRVDESTADHRRFGFAYGTLPAHVEEGEERFMIEMLADGSVWYDLRAFSRPRFWPVRLLRPLARRLQKRFVRQSLTAMRDEVKSPVVPLT
jgi:uncharacterized protein (UPF0548 family)